MTKAIIYCRYSSRRDAELSESNEMQLDYCRAYCRRHGYPIVGEFADEELSGDDEERAGLWDALAAIHRGMVLVVYKADRLARSVYLSEYIHRELVKRKATCETVEGGRNGDSPEDVCVRQVFAAFSELEKKVIAVRTKAAMLRHQENNRAMSKIPPYGKRVGPVVEIVGRDGKTLKQQQWLVHDAELVVINQILVWRAGTASDAPMGLRAIARRLNEGGVPARGQEWNHRVIQRICQRGGTSLMFSAKPLNGEACPRLAGTGNLTCGKK